MKSLLHRLPACLLALVFFAMVAAHAADAEPPKSADNPTPWDILSAVPAAISGNPGAVNVETGNGLLQSFTRLSPDTGVKFGGIWLGDYNILMSGGAQPGASSWNSLLIASLKIDAEKLIGWKGADFGVQFLQFNGQNTNGQAGSDVDKEVAGPGGVHHLRA